mmetsp:Transcript_31023/g.86911  ORF Transcript_31023/g.86911 Transcript_31023/m.86911 type:complete len:227 (-) Transcript_31023:1905-2585(-)
MCRRCYGRGRLLGGEPSAAAAQPPGCAQPGPSHASPGESLAPVSPWDGSGSCSFNRGDSLGGPGRGRLRGVRALVGTGDSDASGPVPSLPLRALGVGVAGATTLGVGVVACRAHPLPCSLRSWFGPALPRAFAKILFISSWLRCMRASLCFSTSAITGFLSYSSSRCFSLSSSSLARRLASSASSRWRTILSRYFSSSPLNSFGALMSRISWVAPQRAIFSRSPSS